SKNAKVTLVDQHELPNVLGKSIKGMLVEYGPGGYSPGHTHPKSAFIYATVLEGAIRSQVIDGPVTTYKAGQSFSELPGDRHGVSANAIKKKPAKLLAVFVVDTNETELTIPFGNRGLIPLSAGRTGDNAMAKTYREIAIEEMLRTVEEAMSQVINWWGDLPPPMKEAIEQFRTQLGAAIDSVEFVKRALDRQVHETERGKGTA